jgi:hypothetical protein
MSGAATESGRNFPRSALAFSLEPALASYDRVLNGACVPVRESGSEIPAESLVK